MKKFKIVAALAGFALLAGVLTSCANGSGDSGDEAPAKEKDIFAIGAAGSCGLTLRDTKNAFSIFTEGSAASDVVTNADGSVTWIATAAGGGGGGVAFYMNANKAEINFANYESIELEFAYSPVDGKWNDNAQNPGFCMRILPWDSTGMFGGYEDLEYFDSTKKKGILKKTIAITDEFVAKITASADFDSILGFALKFNDYQRGNSDGDQLKVQLKNVTFKPKAGAPADQPFDDGLTAADRGTVQSIYYPTQDYVEYNKKQNAIAKANEDLANATTEEERADAEAALDAANAMTVTQYNKHAWVYLPADYDGTKTYPVFILLHGFAQNENTWGLSDQGRGGKIKGYMDRGMKAGDVKKFILVVATGVASKNWGPNGAGYDFNGFNAFGGELRNDLLPYINANFKTKTGRDNVAIAGLSMGGGQTFTIGIGECLDLISNFAGFSGALFSAADSFITNVDAKFDASLKIHNLYMTCGDNDGQVYGSYPGYVAAMEAWDRVENFEEYTFPGGTHDFPVWYHGFNDFIQMVFK